jgi:hypothetical protein
MEYSKLRVVGVYSGLGLLLIARAVTADPIQVITTPSGTSQSNFEGSNALSEVVNNVLLTLPLLRLARGYVGIGSAAGQRQMEGDPNAGEPACTPTKEEGDGAYLNPGCQEIAPMSGELDSNVCDDDYLSPNAQNVSAQEIAFARNGIVVVTDNGSHRQYADSSAACTNASSAATRATATRTWSTRPTRVPASSARPVPSRSKTARATRSAPTAWAGRTC